MAVGLFVALPFRVGSAQAAKPMPMLSLQAEADLTICEFGATVTLNTKGRPASEIRIQLRAAQLGNELVILEQTIPGPFAHGAVVISPMQTGIDGATHHLFVQVLAKNGKALQGLTVGAGTC